MFRDHADRRRRVMLGDLPPDFLRIDDYTRVPDYVPSSESDVVTGVGVSNLKMTFPVELCLTVEEAELTATRPGIVPLDPYIVVHFGQTCLKTNTHLRGGNKPCWNKLFQVSLPHNIRTIFFNMFDENMLIQDKCIGTTICTLPDKLFEGAYLNLWLPIYNRKNDSKVGRLHIYAYLLPSESSGEVQASAPPPATVPVSFAISTNASVPTLGSVSAPLLPSASAPLMPSASASLPYACPPCVSPYAAFSPAQYRPNTHGLFVPVSQLSPPSYLAPPLPASNMSFCVTDGPYSPPMIDDDDSDVSEHSYHLVLKEKRHQSVANAYAYLENKDINFQRNLQKLIEMFPNFTGSQLLSILKECNGNIFTATEKLVDM